MISAGLIVESTAAELLIPQTNVVISYIYCLIKFCTLNGGANMCSQMKAKIMNITQDSF